MTKQKLQVEDTSTGHGTSRFRRVFHKIRMYGRMGPVGNMNPVSYHIYVLVTENISIMATYIAILLLYVLVNVVPLGEDFSSTTMDCKNNANSLSTISTNCQ